MNEPTLWDAPPFVASSLTSLEAAFQIKPSAESLRERVYRLIRKDGPLTDEQIARLLDLNPSTARPRRVELTKAGRITQVGEGRTLSGRRAALWGVVDIGGRCGSGY